MTAPTPEPGKVVEVSTIPDCNFCQDGTPGPYDFATKFGPWANGCEAHWIEHRASPGLGVGKAQLWVLPSEPAIEREVDLAYEGTLDEALAGLRARGVEAVVVDESGPGGGWPVVAVRGPASTVETVLHEIGFDEFDPGDHPDADRPPGTSGSWGEA